MNRLTRLAAAPASAEVPFSLKAASRDPWVYVVFLFTIAFNGPALRWLFYLGDEGVSLHAAVRTLGGESLYTDFFEFLGPGSFWLVTAWMKVFGTGFASVRTLAIVTVALIATLLYVAVRIVTGVRPLALALAVAWVVRIASEVNHHFFTTAASMASAVCLLAALGREPGRQRFWLGAGVLAGIAAMITQSRGALMCGAVVVAALAAARPRFRCALYAATSIVLVVAATAMYLAATASLTTAYRDAIRYPLQNYSAIQAVPFGALATFGDLAVAFYPITFGLALICVFVPGVSAWTTPAFRGALAVATAGLIGTYPRPDIYHILYTLPLACPLFALSVTTLLRCVPVSMWVPIKALALTPFVLSVVSATIPRIQTIGTPATTVRTARGQVELRTDAWAEHFAMLVGEIAPIPSDEPFFFYPYMAMAPYLTARRHVATIDVMLPGYTTPVEFAQTCKRVLSEARWVVIDRAWSDPAWLKRVFPSMRDPNPVEKRRFDAAIAQAFQAVHTSRSFELRRRIRGAPGTLCDGVATSPGP